uniref:ClbS/DfsB family four-helix bundle protein n=2 Tax=Thermorudis TaxID=1649508 RepID=A0A7C3ALZ6_9BACT
MTISTQERLAILRDIAESWLELRKALVALSEHELVEPNTVGTWSFKDLMAHITAWERLLIERIRALEEGRDTNEIEEAELDVDAFNAEVVRRQAEKPIDEVRDEFDTTHSELMELLETTPMLTRDLVAGDTYEHYREHLKDVLEFMRTRSPSRRKHLR